MSRHSLRRVSSALLAGCALGLAGYAVARAPTPAAHAAAADRGTSAFASVALAVPATEHAPPFDQPRTLRLPTGWTATVWARITDARLEAWTPEDHLLVSSPMAGTVTELRPAPGGVAAQHTILSGLTNPQGMAFDRIGGHEVLYVAESNELDRYRWAGRPGARTVLVHDLPDTQPAEDIVHRLKNVVVGKSHTIYVDIGSSSNANPPSSWHGTPRAAVIAYRPNGTRRRVLATGVRNGDGLAFAPDGTLWAAVNERDDITYPFRRPYGSTRAAFGKVIPGYVSDHPPDQRGLPAHSAPLGFHFLTRSRLPAPWANGAVVAAHGSLDRQPPRPPIVYWMPWEAKGRTLGPAIALVSGFQGPDGSRWGRTADALPGPDGALYVSDDTAGAVYRIVPGG